MTIRLRTMFAVLTVIAVLLGITVKRWGAFHAEINAARHLETAWRDGLNRSIPLWPVSRMDEDPFPQAVDFRDVFAVWRRAPDTHVMIGQQRILDSDLQRCNSFQRLTQLTIHDCGLTDAQFSTLNALQSLEFLDVSGNPLHDDTAKRVSVIRSLRYLHLQNTKITDSGVCFLRGLPALQYLNLSNTAITDRSASCLADCRGLQSLYLDHTNITDAAVLEISRLPRLAVLDLSDTDISDEGVRILAKIKGLTDVTLSGTQVTSKAISILEAMPQLQRVAIEESEIDPSEVQAFQDRLNARHLPP